MLSASRVAIDGSTYWNAGVRIGRASRLLRSDRMPTIEDDDRYKSLFPSNRNIDLNAGISHPIGNFSGSLGFNAGINGSRGLLGRNASRVLQDRQNSQSFNLSMTLGTGWRFSDQPLLRAMRGAGATVCSKVRTPLQSEQSRSKSEKLEPPTQCRQNDRNAAGRAVDYRTSRSAAIAVSLLDAETGIRMNSAATN